MRLLNLWSSSDCTGRPFEASMKLFSYLYFLYLVEIKVDFIDLVIFINLQSTISMNQYYLQLFLCSIIVVTEQVLLHWNMSNSTVSIASVALMSRNFLEKYFLLKSYDYKTNNLFEINMFDRNVKNNFIL